MKPPLPTSPLPLLAALVLAAIPVRAQTGYYTLSSGTDSQSGQTFAATQADQSSVWVYGGGNLTLTNGTLTKTGNPSSSANNYQASSQYGINAGVLAGSYNGTTGSIGTITISGNTTVSTMANGANGLYATYGSSITMTGGSINTTGTFSHGADVTYGGSITLNGTTITTSGSSGSAGLSTDFGGGTINATNVNVTTAGSGSPAIYSTGTISVTGSTMKANGGNGGIIDGGNTIDITSSSLTALTNGIRIFRSAPGTTSATVVVNGGQIAANGGDIFFVDGSSSGAAIANLTLKGGATVSTSSGILVHATVGTATTHTTNAATFTADGETLTGNLVTDAYSTISSTLQNSTTLTGFINNAAAGTDNLTIDATSTWNVSAASTLSSLTSAGAIAGTGSIAFGSFTLQSGTVSAPLAGSGALTKNTAGIAILSGANSYTGATLVTVGALKIQSNSALGSGSGASTSGVSVSSGAALQLQGGLSTTTAVNLMLNGAGLTASPNGAIENVSGLNFFLGLLSLGSAATLGSDAGTLELTNPGTITGSGFGLTLKGTGNGLLDSAIGTGAGTLMKTGTGAWTLAGASTYAGATTVASGALIVSGSLSPSSAVSVTDGAALDGAGTVGPVTASASTPGTSAGGAIDPGNGAASVASNGTVTGNGVAGILRTGNFNLGSGAHLAIQLGGTAAGASDQVSVAGSVTLGGDLQLSLINGYAPSVGDKFYVLLNDGSDSISTHFSNDTALSAGGDTFVINYADNGDTGSVANDVSITVQSVPEPSAWSLTLGGGLALAGISRRRKTLSLHTNSIEHAP